MKTQKHLSPTTKFFSLPETVTIDGKPWDIRWDFETAFRFMEYVDRSEDEDELFLETVLDIWYPQRPENQDEALTEAIRFYCGGTLPSSGYYAPAISPDTCKEGLYLWFLKRYGIDLNRDSVHWWIFRQLMEDWKGGNAQ